MRICIQLATLLLLLVAGHAGAQTLTGERPRSCTDHPAIRGQYKILSISNGKELQFYLEIKPKYRTDDNYVAVAKELRERYCEAEQLRVIYLRDKKQWHITDPEDPDATPLAIFYTGKNSTEEGITVYARSGGKAETRTLTLR